MTKEKKREVTRQYSGGKVEEDVRRRLAAKGKGYREILRSLVWL